MIIIRVMIWLNMDINHDILQAIYMRVSIVCDGCKLATQCRVPWIAKYWALFHLWKEIRWDNGAKLILDAFYFIDARILLTHDKYEWFIACRKPELSPDCANLSIKRKQM